MDSYDDWRGRLKTWADQQPGSLQAKVVRLSARVRKNRGVDISPFTIRYHLEGRFLDVSLRLAKAVSDEIEEDAE